VFAARIEMPVVLRGGMLDDRPALVPAGLPDGVGARMPRRFGTAGWIAATALCAMSVYAVRDTMFAPLAQSDAPSSAWETPTRPGDTAPTLVAATGSTHDDHDDRGDGRGDGDGSATGTTISDVDPGQPSAAGGGTAAGDSSAGGLGPATPPSVPGGDGAPASTVDPSTSSTPSTSTPDTLGGHGANSGGGKGGPGNSAGP
jgi:hypothetical protein